MLSFLSDALMLCWEVRTHLHPRRSQYRRHLDSGIDLTGHFPCLVESSCIVAVAVAEMMLRSEVVYSCFVKALEEFVGVNYLTGCFIC
jgi:hypothetical protein